MNEKKIMKTANKEKQFEDPIYKCFLAAFREELKSRERKVISVESGVTVGYISDILTLKAKASYDKREAISIACDKGYLEFLASGWNLISSEFVPTPPENDQCFILSPESKTEAEPEIEIETEDESMKELASLVAELSRENRILAKENKDLALRVQDLENKLEGLQRGMDHGQSKRPVNE